MKYKISMFLVLVILFSAKSIAHPIKMSTGKVSYNKEQRNIEVTLNFFIDDFLQHLKVIYHSQDLDFKEMSKDALSIVEDYIRNKLKISVNFKPYELKILTTNIIEENVFQVILILDNFNPQYIKTIEISNELLIDAFKDQSNIIHIQMDKDSESQPYRFMRGNTYKVFKINYQCN